MTNRDQFSELYDKCSIRVPEHVDNIPVGIHYLWFPGDGSRVYYSMDGLSYIQGREVYVDEDFWSFDIPTTVGSRVRVKFIGPQGDEWVHYVLVHNQTWSGPYWMNVFDAGDYIKMDQARIREFEVLFDPIQIYEDEYSDRSDEEAY